MRGFLNIGLWPSTLLLLVLSSVLVAGCNRDAGDRATEEARSAEAGRIEAAIDQGKLHFDAGISNLYSKNYDGAIEEFELSLKYNPHSPSTLNNIGFAYFDKGDIDSALEYQARALEADSEFANAYYGLALVLESRGDTDGALVNWKEFLKRIEPGSKWAQKAETHIKKLEKGTEAEEGSEKQ
jgi:tetratricopeptide (TPR) repeat protein